MRLRTCSNFHFIRAIKDGLVTKIDNVDSRGRPGLTFKKLEDILGVADSDVAGPPIVDRNTRERGAEITKFGFNGEDVKEVCDSDELNFGEITLTQLKKKCKAKKRKAAEPVLLIPKQEPGDLESDDDDLDLKQPLSSWKSKLSKSPKSKRKRAKKISLSSHEDALSLNSEQINDAEDALQSSDYICLKITIKDECQEAEYTDSENMIHITDSPIRNQQTNLCGEEESGKNNETVNCNSKGNGPICAVSEVSYGHLEHIEPRFPLTWDGGENTDMGPWEMGQQPLVLPASEFKGKGDVNNSPLSLSYVEVVSPDKNQSPRTFDSSQSCPDMQVVVSQVNENVGVEVSEMITDNDLCSKGLGVGKPYMFKDDAMEVLPQNQGNVSPSSGINNSCSTWKWDSCLSPENEVVPVEDDLPSTMKKPLLTSTSADTSMDYLNSKHHLAFLEDGSHMHEEKQPFPISADSEIKVSNYSYPSDTVSEPSSSEIKNYHINEPRQLPERLPLTRKVISPTSQEKLCLAMNSCESFSEIDLYKCKEKLYFGKPAVGKASLAGLDIKQSTEKSCHPKGPEEVIPMKFTINSKQILKKQKNDKKRSPPSKGSPPNCCLEGPRLCRSLPRLSTGCKSIQACSESAIAFSQRQMQDIESLALKLMTELKSMKDIVEEKMLYESYRSTSLKNDADEVKAAIKTAAKTEETARKWLSMMARDCTRFCKIMKLTDNDAPAFESTIQENTPQREKKISFADEAGGMLCNIKFFEDGIASQESRSETVATS